MLITLQHAGKRYNNHWVFRHLSLEFKPHGKYAIIGPNGSGKSTLLRLVSGILAPTEGTVTYGEFDSRTDAESIFRSMAISAPYLDIPDEYSLAELIAFHKNFKKLKLSLQETIVRLELEHAENKPLKHFSSGMKQRVKLGIAIMTDTPILLLDEPSTALDTNAIKWYQNLINEYGSDKTILVFSNNKQEEYSFCNEILNPFVKD